MLIVEKDALLKAYQRGVIGKEAFEHLGAELDERRAKVKDPEGHVPLEQSSPSLPDAA
ncbi:hypothetical protein [Archangium violaceum]|uniref:hypothetical protein n=1 Tax=Archangium violaceum TaxID=83451 RepID=UPI001EF62919|nr:hypothetical protein [Archangium violaceum]